MMSLQNHSGPVSKVYTTLNIVDEYQSNSEIKLDGGEESKEEEDMLLNIDSRI